MKQKIKIMEQKPDLSDDEIRSYMDFDKVLASHRQIPASYNRIKLIATLSLFLLGLTGGWIIYSISGDTNTGLPSGLPSGVKRHGKSPSDDNAAAAPAISDADESARNNTDVKPQEEVPAVRSKPESKKPAAKNTLPQKSEPPADAYVQAEPIDGYPKFYDYLNTNLKYPPESKKDSIQGVVTVTFTINGEGKAENIRIRQSLGKAFDAESIRVIENMPGWKPASLNGKPVASQISIPLTFHLETLK